MEPSKTYFLMKVVSIPLYKGKIVVVLTNSKEELRKRNLPCSDKPELFAFAAEGGYWKGYIADVVVLNIEHPDMTFGVICHEAMHVTNSVMRRIGAETENEETHAHLLEWVTDRIHQTINEYKKKNDILLKS